jgi:ethanolaminephosphotransferase
MLISLIITLRALSVTIFSVIITMMRHHLFIWTVFSPKYFYEVFHTLFDVFQVILLIIVLITSKISNLEMINTLRE